MTTDRATPRRRQLALVVLAFLTLAACGTSDDQAATTTTGARATTTQPSVTSVPGTGGAGAPATLRADLTGTAEVPGPGDPSANGGAVIIVDPAKSEVCWELIVTGLDPAADKAHIHRGAPGQAGDVVVSLTPPTGRGASTGCAPAGAALITELSDMPQGFYVNVHNSTYPGGAVRGQLAKAG